MIYILDIYDLFTEDYLSWGLHMLLMSADYTFI